MSVELDHASMLASVSGEDALDVIEDDLAARGLTLGVDLDAAAEASGGRGAPKVADWLARGARGAPSAFVDPADHLLAGLEARLRNGRMLVVRPCPRRAVGPDLVALIVSAGDRFGRVERAWLRVHRRDAKRPAWTAPPGVDLDPPVSADEARLLEKIERALLPPEGAPPGGLSDR